MRKNILILCALFSFSILVPNNIRAWSISGIVDYYGNSTGTVAVAVWNTLPITGSQPVAITTATNAGELYSFSVPYSVTDLSTGTYYLAALRLRDGFDGSPQKYDPWAVLGTTGNPTAIVITVSSQNITGKNMTLSDGTDLTPCPFWNPGGGGGSQQAPYTTYSFTWHNLSNETHTYGVNLFVWDSSGTAASVKVSGPGIGNGTTDEITLLQMPAEGGAKQWVNWMSTATLIMWPSAPAPPFYYSYKVTDSSGTQVFISTVTAFMEKFPAFTLPYRNQNWMENGINLSWGAVPGAQVYKLSIYDQGLDMSSSTVQFCDIETNLTSYNLGVSSHLVLGHFYTYSIESRNSGGNISTLSSSFRYKPQVTINGINPPSLYAPSSGSPEYREIMLYGKGFIPGSWVMFYQNTQGGVWMIPSVTYIDQYSLKLGVYVSSVQAAGYYDLSVTSGLVVSRAEKILTIKNSTGGNSIAGKVTNLLTGTAAYVIAFRAEDQKNENAVRVFVTTTSTNNFDYTFTGLPDGAYNIASFIDLDNDFEQVKIPEPEEPIGFSTHNPVYVSGSSSVTGKDLNLIVVNRFKTYISAVNPPALAQGDQDKEVHIYGGNFLSVSPVPSSILQGPFITVSSLTVVSDNEILVRVNVSTMAPAGYRIVSIKDNTGYIASAVGLLKIILVQGAEGSGTITGTINYLNSAGTGNGQLSGRIVIAVWKGGLLQGEPVRVSYANYYSSAPETISYSINGLSTEKYGLFAFLDVNSDNKPDSNEPVFLPVFNPVQVIDGLDTRIDIRLSDIKTTVLPRISVLNVYPKYLEPGKETQIVINVTPYSVTASSLTQIHFGQGISLVGSPDIQGSSISARIAVSSRTFEGFRSILVINPDGTSGAGFNMLIVKPLDGSSLLLRGKGSISGTLYNNTTSTGNYVVALWNGFIFNGAPVSMIKFPAQALSRATYTISGLPDSAKYFIGAYIDENANEKLDHNPKLNIDEAEAVYPSLENPKPVVISGGAQVVNTDLTFNKPKKIAIKGFFPKALIADNTERKVVVFGYGFQPGLTESSVTVSGYGVTVSSVTWIDYSQILLDIRTGLPAPSSNRDVTIINPDGSSDTVKDTEGLEVVGSLLSLLNRGEKPFTVTVRNPAGIPVSGAMVAAINFDSSNQPDGEKSRIGWTGPLGNCVLFLSTGTAYMIAAEKHSHFPSIKTQMNDPSNMPVTVESASKNVVLTHIDPYSAATSSFSRVGVIKGRIDNVKTHTKPRLLIITVTNKKTDEPVNFSAVYALGKTVFYRISNIPISAGIDDYTIGVYDPVFKIATAREIGESINLSPDGIWNAVEANLDFENLLSVSASGNDTGAETGGAFEGYIYKDSNANGIYDEGDAGIPNARLIFRSYAYRDDGSNAGIEKQVEVLTNSDGKYTVSDLPVYSSYTLTGQDFRNAEVQKNYIGPENSVPNNNTYAVTIFAPGYKGVNDYYGSATGRYSDSDRTFAGSNKVLNYAVTPAAGIISGKVYLNNALLPICDVVVWPDGRTYGNNPPEPGLSIGQFKAENGSFTILGLDDGNYILNIYSEFMQYGLVYNDGENRKFDGSDDFRVSIKDGLYSIYQASSGIKIADYQNPVNITVKSASDTTATTLIRGTITKLKNTEMTNAVIIAREDWNTVPKENNIPLRPQRSAFVIISGTGTSINYELSIPTGTFQVRFQAPGWGALGEPEYKLTALAGETRTGLDFSVSLSGKIRGIVRKPDGNVFKPDWTGGEYVFIEAKGQNINCRRGETTNENGEYVISGLLPGTYNIQLQTPDGIQYSNPLIKDVVVNENGITEVNISLEIAGNLKANVSGIPDASTGTVPGFLADIKETGTADILTNVLVLIAPQGERIIIADRLLQDDSALPSSTYVNSFTGGTVSWAWNTAKVKPGSYDLYLAYFSLYNKKDNDYVYWYNEAPFGTILEKKSGVTITTGTVLSSTFTFTKGAYEITGSVSGADILTGEDLKKLKADFSYFNQLMPKIILLDSDGNQKAGAAAVPVSTYTVEGKWLSPDLNLFKQWAVTGDITAARTYFAGAAKLKYRIKALVPGNYTLIAKSRNYPPVIKTITITSASLAQNLNFDIDAAAGCVISGQVKDSLNGPISGATVLLDSGADQLNIQTAADGTYSFRALLKGIYKIKVIAQGYGTKEDKVIVSTLTVTKDFVFEPVSTVRASLSGTVYKSKIPYPKTYPEAKVVLIDETEMGLSVKRIASKSETTTDENGQFAFSDIPAGHFIKIFVFVPGYRLAGYSVVKTTYNQTMEDIILAADPPRMSVFSWRDREGNIRLLVESNKALASDPAITFVQGVKTFNVPGTFIVAGLDNTWSIKIYGEGKSRLGELNLEDLLKPELENGAGFLPALNIGVRVKGSDGSQEGVAVAGFGVNSRAKVQQLIASLIAIGGEVEVDRSGEDKSKVYINPGTLQLVFSSAAPTITIDKLNKSSETSVGALEDRLIASDVYKLNLEDAVLASSAPLTLTLDYDESKDTGTVRVCYYDSASRKWLAVSGNVTRDHQTGTVEIDIIADDIKTAAGAPMLAYAPFDGKKYSVANMIRPKQGSPLSALSGQGLEFAVFTDAPNYAPGVTAASASAEVGKALTITASYRPVFVSSGAIIFLGDGWTVPGASSVKVILSSGAGAFSYSVTDITASSVTLSFTGLDMDEVVTISLTAIPTISAPLASVFYLTDAFGTSVFANISVSYASTLDKNKIIAYPTPVKNPSSTAKVYFSGVPRDATIRIYTATAELVKEIEKIGAVNNPEWDLKNKSGEKAASGVYIYLITDKDSKNKVSGKLMIIR